MIIFRLFADGGPDLSVMRRIDNPTRCVQVSVYASPGDHGAHVDVNASPSIVVPRLVFAAAKITQPRVPSSLPIVASSGSCSLIVDGSLCCPHVSPLRLLRSFLSKIALEMRYRHVLLASRLPAWVTTPTWSEHM